MSLEDEPAIYGPPKTLYNRNVRWAAKGLWRLVIEALAAAGPPSEVLIDSKHVKARRSAAGGKGGAHAQAIGTSRGGRITMAHDITDRYGRPLAFHPTPGQAADCRAAEHLLDHLPERCIVHADRVYDTNRVRGLIEGQRSVPNIPPKSTRLWKSCFSQTLYKGRNAIERIFWRLKDCGKLATRYDRLATNFVGSIHVAAVIVEWL